MAEAKVFPMNTFVAYLRGVDKDKQKKAINDFLAFVTQKDVDDDFAPVAAALSKAWVYEQHPELAKLDAAQISAYGQKVSIMPLPEDVLAEAGAISDKLAALKAEVAAQAAKIKELEGKLADASAKLNVADAKVKTFETQQKTGDKKLEVSEKKLDDYSKKLEALLAQIDEVKAKGVVVTGAPGAAADAGAGEAASGPVDSGPADDFGFGSDAFNNSDW